MEDRRKMTASYITSKLRSYLKKHKIELAYATSMFVPNDVIDFNVSIEGDYFGKDFYSFGGSIEFSNPKKDGITEWIRINSRVYIEEGDDNEPKFGKVETIFVL